MLWLSNCWNYWHPSRMAHSRECCRQIGSAWKQGQSPVCPFPRRNACNNFNSKMLHKLLCTDEVDEICNQNKQTAEKLAKLNENCNMTAGLEAKLAVGVQVMLRCTIDTNTGLNYCHSSPFPLPPFPLPSFLY